MATATTVDVDRMIRDLLHPSYKSAKGLRAVVSGNELTVYGAYVRVPGFLHALDVLNDHLGTDHPLRIDMENVTIRADLTVRGLMIPTPTRTSKAVSPNETHT